MNTDTSIRLSKFTAARLRLMRQEIVDAVQSGRMADPGLAAEQINPQAGELSYDQLITLLLNSRDAHNARAEAQRDKQKAQRAAKRQGTQSNASTNA